MTALQVVGICAAAAVACALLRPARPELALAVALAGGVAALFALRGEIAAVAGLFSELIAGGGLNGGQGALLMRAMGIGLITDFGAGLCRDAGESALAARIELAARVTLLAMAAPLARDMLALVRAFCQ